MRAGHLIDQPVLFNCQAQFTHTLTGVLSALDAPEPELFCGDSTDFEGD